MAPWSFRSSSSCRQASARAADPPRRKPLSPEERNAVLTLIKAVDLAQETDVTGDQLGWEHHVLKAPHTTAYVPFRIEFGALADAIKSRRSYVRAVSRHDGLRAKDEHSFLRDWLLHAARRRAARPQETVFVPARRDAASAARAIGSRRDDVAGGRGVQRALALQQRRREAEGGRRRRQEAGRDAGARSAACCRSRILLLRRRRAGASRPRRSSARWSLPPGEYDVFVGLIDRAQVKTSSPAVIAPHGHACPTSGAISSR